MKAVIYKNYGSPEVLEFAEAQKPAVGDIDVLVKVHATTVNRTDTGFRSAEYFVSRFFSGLLRPKNQVLGCEFAGEVVEVGPQVTKFVVGDGVFGFDDEQFGGYGEFKAISQDKMIARIPAKHSYAMAAPILEGAHYCLFYIRAAKITKDSRVLVNGGTGAIGSAAVQILKSMGAYVVATAPTDHITTVESLGADKVVDWQKIDFTKLDETFDVVFDSVGKSSFKKTRRLLTPDGVYMSTELGDYNQNPFLALKTKFIGKQKVLFPIPKLLSEDAKYLADLAEKGEYAPLIDATYDIADIVEATKYVESGQKIGNVVIRVTSVK